MISVGLTLTDDHGTLADLGVQVPVLSRHALQSDGPCPGTYIVPMANSAPRAGHSAHESMMIDWDFTAQSFMDQLPPSDRSKVLYAVERLRELRHPIVDARIARLLTAGQEEFVLRVGDDLRVVFQREDETIRVVDVFRRSQLEDVRQLQPHG